MAGEKNEQPDGDRDRVVALVKSGALVGGGIWSAMGDPVQGAITVGSADVLGQGAGDLYDRVRDFRWQKWLKWGREVRERMEEEGIDPPREEVETLLLKAQPAV